MQSFPRSWPVVEAASGLMKAEAGSSRKQEAAGGREQQQEAIQAPQCCKHSRTFRCCRWQNVDNTPLFALTGVLYVFLPSQASSEPKMSLKGPLLSPVESQDNTWCLVGPEGRHKHWQSAQGSAAASVNNKVDFSLASLPGPAIASILHHLDIYSSHQLARTCRTCAREAAHYRTHYKRDYCAKILPSVQSVAGIRGDHYGDRYGELKCAWTGSSCDALPYIHTMSQQPDFLASMWKAAWSAVPHSFFTDIRSMWGEAMSGDFGYGNKGSCLTIQLFVHSTTPLHVSLAWLQAFCGTAKATIIQKFLDEGAGYVDNVMDITCWVYRPQGQLQEDECDGVESPQGGSWKYVSQHPPPNRDWYSRYEPVAWQPEHSIAVTGSWCDFEKQVFTCEPFPW